MNLLNRLSKRFQLLILGLLAIAPLLLISPSTAAADDEASLDFTQAELDQMLAPIALYPDTLLSQVLIASTYPLEVVQADRWARSNKDLKTEDALKFAENKDWDPSVKALVAFPDVLQRMSENIDWTQRLGDAFLDDEDEVMEAVQRLRKRAYATGSLEKAKHISVEQEEDNIIIEPAQERIVYVPVYDTRVVYGNWWWPEYPPVYWHYPSSYTYVSGFYWGSSIYVGPTYFYSSCHWRNRRVVVIDRHRHYSDNHRFYTGRSIVRHQSSREWRHDPAHRHGVAYYNNNLRETYGSRRESRQREREYREQHREFSRPDSGHRIDDRRSGNTRVQVNSDGPRNVDRAERVKDRLNNQQAGDNNGRVWRANADNNRNQGLPAPVSNGNEGNPERFRDTERTRSNIEQRQTEFNRGNGEDRTRAAPERRFSTEQAHPDVSHRTEHRVPGSNMERREEPPRRAEIPQPRVESRNEQRGERIQTRIQERQDRTR